MLPQWDLFYDFNIGFCLLLCLNLNKMVNYWIFWNSQTAEEAMTPIESTFSLDVSSKLDWWVQFMNDIPLAICSPTSWRFIDLYLACFAGKQLEKFLHEVIVVSLSILEIPKTSLGFFWLVQIATTNLRTIYFLMNVNNWSRADWGIASFLWFPFWI